MNRVQPIYDYTNKLLDLLVNNPDMDRDEKISQIQEYLGKRETEINGLAAPFNDQEKELGAKLLNLNKRLNILLDREKGLIQKDLKDLHAKKDSNQKYTNPYESLSTGGVFYDKRN